MGRNYLQDVEPYNTHFDLPDPGKSALLVIDMQEHFAALTDLIIDNVLLVIEACRFSDVRIYFTRHGHLNPSQDGGLLVKWWGEAIECGTPQWEIVAPLMPRPNEPIIDKKRYSAFYGTNLEILLREKDIEDVIICGILTNCCCETTARDAFIRDFRVFFLSDATTAVAEDLHIATLKNLAYGFAYILDTESLCRYLKYSATRGVHREFI